MKIVFVDKEATVHQHEDQSAFYEAKASHCECETRIRGTAQTSGINNIIIQNCPEKERNHCCTEQHAQNGPEKEKKSSW